METVIPDSATPSHIHSILTSVIYLGLPGMWLLNFENIIWSLVEEQGHMLRDISTVSSARDGGIPQTPHCTLKAKLLCVVGIQEKCPPSS